MATVLVFHHALGRTEGILEFARRLEEAGHRVIVPDLFDGLLFASVDEGVAHAESTGFEAIIDRGVAAAAEVTGQFVVAGFSLGAMAAQKVAQSGSGSVEGAVLYHSAVPPEFFGSPWPAGLPLQIHITPGDPWAEEDIEVARELVGTVGAMVFEYPGSGHLVADPTSDDHDPATADLMVERTLTFLSAIPRRTDPVG
ncbi:MAG: dienelactone hydrolase family protein [Acidimicrobiia bacterium]|nr:dienelactone hydrolase family protein [Acidimicrobiia bacterium]MDH5520849.1 dienelactone hydrolase family protein [Acidimicrobiia bacterium]